MGEKNVLCFFPLVITTLQTNISGLRSVTYQPFSFSFHLFSFFLFSSPKTPLIRSYVCQSSLECILGTLDSPALVLPLPFNSSRQVRIPFFVRFSSPDYNYAMPYRPNPSRRNRYTQLVFMTSIPFIPKAKAGLVLNAVPKNNKRAKGRINTVTKLYHIYVLGKNSGLMLPGQKGYCCPAKKKSSCSVYIATQQTIAQCLVEVQAADRAGKRQQGSDAMQCRRPVQDEDPCLSVCMFDVHIRRRDVKRMLRARMHQKVCRNALHGGGQDRIYGVVESMTDRTGCSLCGSPNEVDGSNKNESVVEAHIASTAAHRPYCRMVVVGVSA